MFTDDGNQDINADGNPDLSLDRVFGVAIEAFDVEVLLDPFEEEFDSPSGTIELRDGECGQFKVIGEEDEFALVFDIVEPHPTERFRVEEGGAGTGEDDGGVATKSGGVIDGSVVSAEEVEVGFGPCDEEGLGRLETVESLEIDVSSIHDIVGTGFEGKLIENSHVM